MRVAVSPTIRIAAGLLLAVLLSVVGYHVYRRWNSRSPDALLKRADEMSWLNSWIAAEPLYRQAERQFTQRHQLSKALYARVSEMPAHSESSTTIPSQIALLRHDLHLPEAHNPETRLRILTVLGMLEVNYDSGMARQTWAEVEHLAIRQHHFLLASRAVGEQGIAAFLLGDITTAKKDVVKAWIVAKVADPGAHIRYASMYGANLVELHIHLALHGYADPEFPDRSALVFAPEEPPTDDGLLQVREIRRLRLNANLVTLSACDTGIGPVGEEGVSNIVNAFIEAGAQSVVSTLWELEDQATAHLMTVFYAHLGRHEDKAEGLRRAQLYMLNSGAPPYYWASFELDGEPNGCLFKETKTNMSLRSSR